MQNPDLGTLGIDPVLVRWLVMHEQIRLQSFNQIQDLRASHFRMNGGAGGGRLGS